MLKILQSTLRYDLGLKNCWSNITDYVTVQGDRFEYLNMMAAVKLKEQPCSDISLPTVQPHLLDCWQALSQFVQTVTCWHVWQTWEWCICVWLDQLITLGTADMVTSLMCIKGLLDQHSRYLEFDRRHKGVFLSFELITVNVTINAVNHKYNDRPSWRNFEIRNLGFM